VLCSLRNRLDALLPAVVALIIEHREVDFRRIAYPVVGAGPE
jgi:hypothetical protein